jgi:sec-independent protein translocase protein TatB
MIDFGFDKIALIGAVALIVIGPEKLPKVARTVGHLFGKAQRYVADVKAEVNRSIELEELKKMKTQFEDAARDVETDGAHRGQPGQQRLRIADWKDATAAGQQLDLPRHEHAQRPAPPAPADLQQAQEELAPQARRHAAVVQAAQGVRTKALSGAARVARFRPPGQRPGTPMSDGKKKDELAGTEAPFVSHLIELRDRLIRAVIAIAVAFGMLAFWPGPSGLYDLLAAPLVAHLPKGPS